MKDSNLQKAELWKQILVRLGNDSLKQVLDAQHNDLNSISIKHIKIRGMLTSARNPRAGEVGTDWSMGAC